MKIFIEISEKLFPFLRLSTHSIQIRNSHKKSFLQDIEEVKSRYSSVRNYKKLKRVINHFCS